MEKLKIKNSKLRQSSADYLCYAMLDMIVDHYFIVMEKLGERIELLEEKIIRNSNKRTLAAINDLRKELIVLKRNVAPVRDLINGFIRSDSQLIDIKTNKYFKDVHDHILQANEFAENYRDMMMNLQDLYLSNVNLKMNEVMKVMTIVTCLLAPATVIGGIFGMNFEVIPIAHQAYGFYMAIGLMLIFPLLMVYFFNDFTVLKLVSNPLTNFGLYTLILYRKQSSNNSNSSFSGKKFLINTMCLIL